MSSHMCLNYSWMLKIICFQMSFSVMMAGLRFSSNGEWGLCPSSNKRDNRWQETGAGGLWCTGERRELALGAWGRGQRSAHPPPPRAEPWAPGPESLGLADLVSS